MARKFGGTVKKTDTVLVTSVDLASADVTGVLPVANGGTGSGSYTDGQLLIGNTASGNTLTKATLTAGSGISITNGGGSITIASSGGLTNWSESAGTYSAKSWVRFYPASGTNVNVVFSPLGTGSIQAHVADGTSTGGNQRGSNAVDWQNKRSAADQVAGGANSVLCGGSGNKIGNSAGAVLAGGFGNVASANYAAISGGYQNTASGGWSFVGSGKANTASGAYSVINGGKQNVSSSAYSGVLSGAYNTASTASYACVTGGASNVASGACSVVLGGNNNIAGGTYSIASGRMSTTRGLYGSRSHASSCFATRGDAQYGRYVLRALTTNATATVLTANAGAASTTNQVVLANNSAYTFKALVTSHRTDTVSGYTHRASWMVDGIAVRDANAASTLVSATINTIYNTPGWTLAVATDTTNGCVKFTFTGEAAKTIRTVAVVETCEVTS